jgi:hypothetical protein
MLDPDAYGYSPGAGGDGTGDQPTQIPIAGKPGTAGTGNVIGGSTGTGGVPPKPVPTAGGKGGTGSLDPSLAVVPCEQYCPGYVADCFNKLMPGQDCLASCEGEINGFGASCQKLGIGALKCLTPFLQPGLTCDTALSQGLAKCGKIVAAFQKCKGPMPAPTPTPTPTPIPPMPVIDVGSCPSMGGGDLDTCKAAFSCPNGLFETFCQPIEQSNTKACSCLGPNGQMASGVFGDVSDACQLAASVLCNF